MPKFVPGQRWTSETEPELGLGMVLRADQRQVMMVFPATGETRNYAAASAPLVRSIFRAGETVVSAEGQSLIIESLAESGGLVSYHGEGITLTENLLGDLAPSGGPEGKLFHGKIDAAGLFALRQAAWSHRARIWSSPVRGFLGARMDLLPHQLYIASQAAERTPPRILLADEVGLGKTIEACLILHRMLLTGRVSRVLILVPEALVHQWFVELLRRFNISISIFDEERCLAAEPGSPSGNPFLDEQLVLASTGFLEEQEARRKQLLEAGWDLLVVDEAHHLAWTPAEAGPLYLLVETLARAVPGVLLLTATPEELGPESHYARMRLLDPDRYPDLAAFLAEHARYVDTAREAEARVKRGDVIDELLDRYGPGRVMFRNTRRNIRWVPRRKAALAPLEPGSSKVAWLAKLLRRFPREKILLIAHSTEQVLKLHRALTRRIEVKAALFHEEMEIVQRDRSAAWFAEEDGARILLCSEIGGEGRNFQFAHHLVLYDLPEHPEILEQRIGRLDRIGQTETICIHVPYQMESREERVVRWLHEGLQAFETCLQGGAEVYQQFKDQLDGDVEHLIAESFHFKVELERRLDEGTNRLLEWHSFNRTSAESTIEAVRAFDRDPAFEPFMLQLFDHLGIHAEEIDHHTYLLLPGHLYRDRVQGFAKAGMTVTLDRRRALDREDLIFLTWDHPLTIGAMEEYLGSGEGSCSVVKGKAGSGSGMVLEAVFVLEPVAPPALQAERFLPATPIRVAVDMEGHPLEEPPPLQLEDAGSPGLFEPGSPLEQRIHDLVERCREEAETDAAARRSEANRTMLDLLGRERDRLAYLAGINDHVHPEELEQLEERMTRLGECIGTSALRLDAVRLVLPGAAG